MPEKPQKLQGTNAELRIFPDHVTINRKKGRNLLDYLGAQEVELPYAEMSRVDFKRPVLFTPGYFRFIMKDEDVEDKLVSARQLNGDKHAIILDMVGSTNVLELDELYQKLQDKISPKKEQK